MATDLGNMANPSYTDGNRPQVDHKGGRKPLCGAMKEKTKYFVSVQQTGTRVTDGLCIQRVTTNEMRKEKKEKSVCPESHVRGEKNIKEKRNGRW